MYFLDCLNECKTLSFKSLASGLLSALLSHTQIWLQDSAASKQISVALRVVFWVLVIIMLCRVFQVAVIATVITDNMFLIRNLCYYIMHSHLEPKLLCASLCGPHAETTPPQTGGCHQQNSVLAAGSTHSVAGCFINERRSLKNDSPIVDLSQNIKHKTNSTLARVIYCTCQHCNRET